MNTVTCDNLARMVPSGGMRYALGYTEPLGGRGSVHFCSKQCMQDFIAMDEQTVREHLRPKPKEGS